MKKFVPPLFATLMLLLASTAALAVDGYPGGFVNNSSRPPYIYEGEREPLPGPRICVSQAREIKNLAPVVLVGKILSAGEHDKYQFIDNSGQITVRIEKDRWNSLTVGPNDLVVIEGKIDRLSGTTEIEATRINTRNHYYAMEPAPRDGPLPMGVVSVEFAKTMPNTAALALEGNIDRKLAPGRLQFHDRSGSIVLNVDEANPLVAGPYSPGDVMVIEGRVNAAANPVEIDVETIVDRSNFAPVIVREETVTIDEVAVPVKDKNSGVDAVLVPVEETTEIDTALVPVRVD